MSGITKFDLSLIGAHDFGSFLDATIGLPRSHRYRSIFERSVPLTQRCAELANTADQIGRQPHRPAGLSKTLDQELDLCHGMGFSSKVTVKKGEYGQSIDSGLIGNWDDLRYFLALGKSGTLAQAARSLGVKVSTVHRRLGGLETDWGVELFHRTPRGHKLTVRGQRLFDVALEVEASVGTLRTELLESDKRHVIRLTTTDDLIEFVSTKTQVFCGQNDKLQIRLLSTERMLNLVQREADIAIRFSQGEHQELVVKPLCTVAFALYASPLYLQTHGEVCGEQDLDKHGFITAEGALASAPIMQWLMERVAPSQIWSTCNTVATMAAVAGGGNGIAALPCFIGDGRPNLVRVMEPIAGTEATAYLAYHMALRRFDGFQKFTEYLKTVFAEHQALFSGT